MIRIKTVLILIEGQKVELRQHFEENMLDGDAIQRGQMMSSESVFEYIVELVQSERTALLDQLVRELPRKTGCEVFGDVSVVMQTDRNAVIDEVTALLNKAKGEK